MNTGSNNTHTGYTGGGCEKVISFAGYIARNGRKSSYRSQREQSNLVQLAGCDVIDLSEKRS